MTDDYLDNINTTGVYSAIGAFQLGAVEVVDDFDWFKVSFFKQHYSYDITLSGNTFDGNTRKQYGGFEIFNAAGNALPGSKTNMYLPRTVSYDHTRSAGDYFIGVGGNGVGGYRFEINYNDVGGTIDTATEIGDDLREQDYVNDAIETPGDADFFEHVLQAGTAYTIDLLGVSSQSTRGTTLGQSVFDMFGPGGARETGTNFDGNNKRIVYTPSVTGTHYFRVRANGGATGSYILKSDQFDDYANDVTTTGVLPLDGTRVHGLSEYRYDSDWFKVELVPGFTYQFNGSHRFALYDSEGVYVDRPDSYYSNFMKFTAPIDEESTYFVVVGTGDEAFWITAEKSDDYTPGVAGNHSRGNIAASDTGAIEIAGDRDRFVANLVKWGAYRFAPRGIGADPLSDVRLAIFDEENNFVTGGNSAFTFTAEDRPGTYTSNYVIDAFASNGTSTGLYDIGFAPGDKAAGDESTSWTANLSTGTARIQNAFETKTDVDWHRINMKAGTTYQIDKLSYWSKYKIVKPDGTSTALSSASQRFFSPTVTGDHYLALDAADIDGVDQLNRRSIEFQITEGAIKQPNSGYLSPDERITSVLDVTGLRSNDQVEVYSDTDLRYLVAGEYVTLPAGELRTFSKGQFQWLTIIQDFEEVGEAFARGVQPVGSSPSHTPWSSVALYPKPLADDIAADADFALPYYTSYAFASGLPSYLTGNPDFAGFATLTTDERTVMKSAINLWNKTNRQHVFQHVVPGAGNDQAHTMIFKAAINSDVLAYRFGDDLDGDIVINTNSPIMADLTPGKQGFFELLRSVGTLVGLNEVTGRSRDESVMGDRNAGSSVFASSPLPADVRAYRYQFDSTIYDPIYPQVFSLASPDPFRESLATSGHTITAEGVPRRVNIDLRPGQSSYVGVSPVDSPNVYMNSYYSRPRNGIGSNFTDGLFGNEDNNELRGGRGNDILVGGQGNDSLFGGANNDYYVFKPGHGYNVIDEEAAGGRDTIRFEGMHNLTSAQDDVTFQRLGNDLIIRLEYDGDLNKNTDTIEIKNMSDPQSRIESLALLNQDGFLERLNLISVFRGADNSRQRFKLTPNANGFGRIAVPV